MYFRFVWRSSMTLVLFLAILQNAHGDAGVFTGNGQNLHQVTSKTIQLVNIDVTIVLGRGPFLFDGSVPGMDEAEYRCSFLLKNLTDENAEVKVGFPVDSQFAQGIQPESNDESFDWVMDYGFIAKDEKATYDVEFVRRKPSSGSGEFGSVFVWTMHFSPKETRKLNVQYRIPMSMGLIPMAKDEMHTRTAGVFGQEFLNIGQLEMAGYITSTGSSWAGNVESATFRLVTTSFERYFNRRGIGEEDDADMDQEDRERFNSSFPVPHPWWYREIEPAGWTPTKAGVEWKYQNYKPKDAIQIRYYTTPFPRRNEEVDPFVKRFATAITSKEGRAVGLRQLREVLLATWGKEPDDPVAKGYVSQQIWYKPRADFHVSDLSQSQKSLLSRFDHAVAAANSNLGSAR